jgi:outer membrane protein TolC
MISTLPLFRLSALFVFGFFTFTFPRFAVAAEGRIDLTLKQAVAMAVEKNLGVKAELYNSAAAEADIRSKLGIYDPLLSLGLNYQQSVTQPTSTLLAGALLSRSKTLQVEPQISQLLPTGGTVALDFNNTWNNNNSDPSRGFLNDYWRSQLELRFSQPLLKDFGREATNLNISVARFNKEGTLQQFRAKLVDTVAQVRTQYFQLYSLRENLEVRKASLALAERILNDTRAQVKAGVLPAMEILSAEFGVATMQRTLIDAERAVSDQVDSLRVLLQVPPGMEIFPAEQPYQDEYAVDEEGIIRQALSRRPELKQLQVSLKTDELIAKVSKHQTLPDLFFTASTALTGLDSRYGKAVERVGAADYPVWEVGLQLSYPLGNRAAQNEYIKNKLKTEQVKVQIKAAEDNVVNEVRNASRLVRSSYKQLDVTSRGSAYAQERLNAYIKKNKVGLATMKDVLDVENDLVTAQGNRIQAIADYNNSITALWRAGSELLEREGITVSEQDADLLYKKEAEGR